MSTATSIPVRNPPSRGAVIRPRRRGRQALILAAFPVATCTTLVVAGLWRGHRADHYFDEQTLGSFLSAGLLMVCAALGAGIYLRRRAIVRGADAALWLLIAGGFLYLAADELFQFHERTDALVHSWTGLTESAISDRMDDLIVLGYGLAGLWVLWMCRAEARMFRPVRSAVIAGFALFFLMVLSDLLSNRYPAAVTVRFDPDFVRVLSGWANVLEDSLKLAAEWAFIVALWAVRARAAGRPDDFNPAPARST